MLGTVHLRPTVTLSLIFASLISAIALLAAPPAGAAVVCDRVAATGGSDAGPGTTEQPFATVQKLAGALGAGQAGCVRGTLRGDVKITRGGAPGAPLTITSEPGQRGGIAGRVWVATGADHVTISDLDLDGRNPSGMPGPLVHGNYATFRGNDVSNSHMSICFALGAATYSPQITTVGTTIEGNRIHNCGELPATNHDHGIYVEKARDTRIAGNVLYDNADRAINLYPDAQRTEIIGNVMDGNGQGVLFSGLDGMASSDNVVRGNIITNPKLRDAIESWYPKGNPIGKGNVVDNNCIYGGAGTVDPYSQGGFTASRNAEVDPLYVDRGAKDFRLAPNSPCASVLATGVVTIPTDVGGGAAGGGKAPAPGKAPAAGTTTAPTPAAGAQFPAVSTTKGAARTTFRDTRRPSGGSGNRQALRRGARLVVTSKARGKGVVVKVSIAGASKVRKVRARIQITSGGKTRTVATVTAGAKVTSVTLSRGKAPRGAKLSATAVGSTDVAPSAPQRA